MQLTDGDQILVTGATGLVGSHVAEQARQRGIRVRALCRPGSDTSLLRDWGVEIVAGDLDDAASLQQACAGAKVIVHCAAKVGDWGPTDEYRQINVHGTRTLLDAALQFGSLKRWVQISSLGVYSGGDVYQYHEVADGRNPFYYFFRAEGQSDKSEADRGRWAWENSSFHGQVAFDHSPR